MGSWTAQMGGKINETVPQQIEEGRKGHTAKDNQTKKALMSDEKVFR